MIYDIVIGMLQNSNILLLENSIPNLRHRYNDVNSDMLNIKLLYLFDTLSLYILNSKYNNIGKIINIVFNIISLKIVICNLVTSRILYYFYLSNFVEFCKKK